MSPHVATPRFQSASAREVDAALARVYARPEFAEDSAPGWIQALADGVAAIREAIARFIVDVLESIGRAAAGSSFGVWLIVGTAVLVVLYVLMTHARRSRGGWRRSSRDGAHAATAASAEMVHDATHWEAEADRAIADGRFRDAAFAFYHATVLRLEERGALRFDAAKTPGDYRREVAHHGDASRVLNGFLRLFEPLAWGRRGEDAETIERLRASALEAAGRG